MSRTAEHLSLLVHKLLYQQHNQSKIREKKTDYFLSFTSILLFNSQWHFASWSEPLCHASAVHRGKITHTARPGPAWKTTESKTEHIFRLDGLYATLFDRHNKSPLGILETQRHSVLVFCPSLKLPEPLHASTHLKEKKGGEALWSAAVMAAAESSSHQGAGRGREQMLISGGAYE